MLISDQNSPDTENVLVLPENYGYGMRSVQDKIWFWEPDEKCLEIWQLARFMLNQEGLNLDIVYRHQDYPPCEYLFNLFSGINLG